MVSLPDLQGGHGDQIPGSRQSESSRNRVETHREQINNAMPYVRERWGVGQTDASSSRVTCLKPDIKVILLQICLSYISFPHCGPIFDRLPVPTACGSSSKA